MKWIKASEAIIVPGKNYFAKWVTYLDNINSSGSFKEEGMFFWNEAGYIPISKDEYADLYILEESPEKVAPIWLVTFAYSGSSKREFFETQIAVGPGENIDTLIKDYVASQNKGESKSDRIRFWSKSKLKQPLWTDPDSIDKEPAKPDCFGLPTWCCCDKCNEYAKWCFRDINNNLKQ